MTEMLKSYSFPNGLEGLRSEQEARGMSMVDVINLGASKRALPRPCPFCGSDPEPASKLAGRYVVGCASDDCHVNPQVGSASLTEAWAIWNTRP